MEPASNMFSLLDGAGEGSIVINTLNLTQKQKKLKEEEERKQKILIEKEKKLKEQEEKEKKQSELTNMIMESLPFKFPHHQRRRPDRRQQDQNGEAKKNGEGAKKGHDPKGSKISKEDQFTEPKQPSSGDDQKSNVSEKEAVGVEGAEKVDEDNKDNNGAEGSNVDAAGDKQKESKAPKKPNKKKNKKKSSNKKPDQADDKIVKSDKKEEDNRNWMTLAEYEKELERKKALKSEEKTNILERKQSLDHQNGLEAEQKVEEIRNVITLDLKESESKQHLQKETDEDDDSLFTKVVSKHAKRAINAWHNSGSQIHRDDERRHGYPNRHNSGYRHESRRPNGGQEFINEERPNRPYSSKGHRVEGKEGNGGGESKGPNGDQFGRQSFDYRRGDNGRHNRPFPGGPSHKDTRKFPDVEDASQFPTLGGARKA